MDHPGGRQARCPGLKLIAAGDGERQVVQAGPRLVERVLASAPVLRKIDFSGPLIGANALSRSASSMYDS